MTKSPAFTKKQIAIIFKIAFLEAMALSIIMPSAFTTGEITSFRQVQTGYASFLIPRGSGGQLIGNIPFPKPYPVNNPVVETWVVSWNATTSTNTVSVVPIGPPEIIQYRIPQNQTSWFNMPAVKTELFGNTFGRIATNQSALNGNLIGTVTPALQLSVNINKTGAVGSYLAFQFSIDNGVTWKGPCFFNGDCTPLLRVYLNSTGVKNSPWSNPVNLLSGNIGKGLIYRITGVGGNGTATPVINSISINEWLQAKGTITCEVGTNAQTFRNSGSFEPIITTPGWVLGLNVTIYWKAWY